MSHRLRTVALALVTLTCFAPGARAQERPFSLEGLVVTTTPTPRAVGDVSADVVVLEGAELQARGLLSVADALRDVAGVSVVRGGSFGATTTLFMRGGESDYVQVLVDGVQVNQPGGSFDFSSLLLADVERIEIVRGPASALHGSDALAGVVHVITRTGRGAPSLEADVRAGSYGRLDGSVSVVGGTDRVGYGLSLARQSTDGILPFNNRHVNTVLGGIVRVVPDALTRAELSVRLGDRNYHFPTDGSGAVVDRNAFTWGDETTVGVGVERRVREGLLLRGHLGVHETDGGTDDAQDEPGDTLGFYASTSADHVRRATGEVGATVFVGDGGVLSLGAEAQSQRQRSFTESSSQFGPSSDRSEYDRWNRAAYAHATWDGRPLSLHVGGRLDDNERYGAFWTWQAGLVWRASSSTRARISAGRGVKEPTFYETYATGFARGNPTLDPEHSTSVEAGMDVTLLGGGLRLEGTGFWQRFSDLIQYTFTTPTPDASNFFNVGRARATGVEFGVEGRAGRLRASGSWTLLRTTVLDPGFDEGPDAAFVQGQRLLRRPSSSGRLFAGYDLSGDAELTVDLRLVGARDDRDFTGVPAKRVSLPGYATLDLGGRIEVRPGALLPALTLSFRAENVLDEQYEEIAGFPTPGRAFYLGAGVRLGR